MSTAAVERLTNDLLAGVSGQRLMELARLAAQGIRLSGSSDERQVFMALEAELRGLGFATRLSDFPGYVSWPGEAQVTVEPAGEDLGPCLTHAMAASTTPTGLTAPVLWASAGPLPGESPADAAGRLLVMEGLAEPQRVLEAEQRGAVAALFISRDQRLRQMIVSPVWGNPTPESEARLPHIPVVTVTAAAGDRLRVLAAAGHRPLQLRVQTQVETGWRTLPLLEAEMPGPAADFVLLSSHVDGWWRGAMDNAAANASAIEVARLLAERRPQWQRGLRLAFWSGHSHGRYCGSAWYADHHWQELRQRAGIHVNIDSTGGQGNHDYTGATSAAQVRALAAGAVQAVTRQTLLGRRPARGGDQSFWGIGLPSLFVGISAASVQGAGPYWHTDEDTFEHLDPEVLVNDTRILAFAMAGLVFSPLLPFRFLPLADELLRALEDLAGRCGPAFDLSPAVGAARRLQQRAGELDRRSAEVGAAAPDAADPRVARLNQCYRRLNWLLVPVDFGAPDPFDHAPALPTPPLGGLAQAARLAALSPGSHEYHLVETRMARECNRVCFALEAAAAEVDASLEKC